MGRTGRRLPPRAVAPAVALALLGLAAPAMAADAPTIIGAPGGDLAITAGGRVVDPLRAAGCEGTGRRDLPG